jgi:hypothetical protein
MLGLQVLRTSWDSSLNGWAHRTLNGLKMIRVWYNYSVEAIRLISMSLVVGVQASAGRGFSPPICIVL